MPAYASTSPELVRHILCDVNEDSAPPRFLPTTRPSRFVRRQRGFGTSRVNSNFWSTTCPNRIVRRQRSKPIFSDAGCLCWLMLARGSRFGHNMASKICNMTLARPKMHHTAPQHGFPSPQNGPENGSEDLGIALSPPHI